MIVAGPFLNFSVILGCMVIIILLTGCITWVECGKRAFSRLSDEGSYNIVPALLL